MHTVEKHNVVDTNKDEYSSYTSILNSAINSTKRQSTRDRINRFFYSVGEHNFLFEKDLKVENLPQTVINKVPHAPSWCVGIVSVRGVIIPVVDMHILLKGALNSTVKKKVNSEQKKGTSAHLLMIEHKNHAPIILQADKIPERVNIKNYTYAKAEKGSPSWLEQTWKNSTNKLLEINHDQLFNIIKPVSN